MRRKTVAERIVAKAPLAEVAPATDPTRRPASYICPCGFREEIKERPAPAALDCERCSFPEGLRWWVPPYAPPPGAGRMLTPIERRALQLG
jgi:hypothetical protein